MMPPRLTKSVPLYLEDNPLGESQCPTAQGVGGVRAVVGALSCCSSPQQKGGISEWRSLEVFPVPGALSHLLISLLQSLPCNFVFIGLKVGLKYPFKCLLYWGMCF